MIAKLIAHGPDRQTALERLTAALKTSHIRGLANNLSFLARLSEDPHFVSGAPDTGLIDRNIEALVSLEAPGDTVVALAAALFLGTWRTAEPGDLWQSLGHWQVWGEASRVVVLDHAGGRTTLRVAAKGRDMFAVQAGHHAMMPLQIIGRFDGGCRVEMEGRQMRVQIFEAPRRLTLMIDDASHEFHLADPFDGDREDDVGDDRVVAPMPGFVKQVRVTAGAAVVKGQALVVMEAMKMELTLGSRQGRHHRERGRERRRSGERRRRSSGAEGRRGVIAMPNPSSEIPGERVTIVEMSPRDGLQNETAPIETRDKIALIDRLSACGFTRIEVTSFVSPKWVPQLADAEQVMAGIRREAGVRYAALTPNMKGFEAALAAGADEVAVFASASESFSQRNINCTIEESIERFRPIAAASRAHGILMRGYVSCVVRCPYEGAVAPRRPRMSSAVSTTSDATRSVSETRSAVVSQKR